MSVLKFLSRKGIVTYNHEFSSVFIGIVDTENTSIDSNIETNREVCGHEGLLRAITLEDHVSLQEGSLGNTTVRLLRLSNHDGLVLKVVENNRLSNSKVFKATFNNALFGVGVESQDLYNKFIRNLAE